MKMPSPFANTIRSPFTAIERASEVPTANSGSSAMKSEPGGGVVPRIRPM
jgi:hypothetical protein